MCSTQKYSLTLNGNWPNEICEVEKQKWKLAKRVRKFITHQTSDLF